MKFFWKLIRNIFILTIIILCGCVFYAFKIEPFRLRVNEYALEDDTSGDPGIVIVQISDLHIKKDFTFENLGKVVEKINKLEPDLVVFSGDLYDNYAQYHDDQNVIDELGMIKARYGKIAVWGNRDRGGGASRVYKDIMRDAGFALLQNESWRIEVGDGKHVLFTGLDDAMLGDPKMPEGGDKEAADYKVLMIHEPDSAEVYFDSGYDLVLSGHSHGGQVNIPFLPAVHEWAVSSTALSVKYNGGMYDVGKDGKTQLYVNTGIGTTHVSARFGVVPEITVFRLGATDH